MAGGRRFCCRFLNLPNLNTFITVIIVIVIIYVRAFVMLVGFKLVSAVWTRPEALQPFGNANSSSSSNNSNNNNKTSSSSSSLRSAEWPNLSAGKLITATRKMWVQSFLLALFIFLHFPAISPRTLLWRPELTLSNHNLLHAQSRPFAMKLTCKSWIISQLNNPPPTLLLLSTFYFLLLSLSLSHPLIEAN